MCYIWKGEHLKYLFSSQALMLPMWYIYAFKYYGVYIYTVLRNVKNSKHGIPVECLKILNNQFQTVMNGAYDVS